MHNIIENMKFIQTSFVNKALMYYVGCFIFLGYTACAQISEPRFIKVPPNQTGILFRNTVPLPSFFKTKDIMFTITAGGTAAGDINNDGLIDIVFTGAYTRNKLFLNKGDFHFEEQTNALPSKDTTGMSFGVSVVDINGDGWNDVFVCKYGNSPNELFINNQDGTFTESAASYGLGWSGNSIHSTFFDCDNDGDLDMYLIVNGKLVEGYKHTGGDQDRFYRNNGNGTFTDVTESAGFKDKGYGLSATAADINNDGWVDLFVGQDFEQRDLLYINQKNGTFKDMANDAFPHSSFFSMGNDIADYNNDGLLDIFSVDMLPRSQYRRNTQFDGIPIFSRSFDSAQVVRNVLHLNKGNLRFSDVAFLAGVANTEWSWTTWFADLDNDGFKDVYVTNGLAREIMDRDINRFSEKKNHDLSSNKGFDAVVQAYPRVLISNFCFRNKGNLLFDDVTKSWGLSDPINTNSAVYADFDNDGDLDIVQNNLDTIPFVFRNMTREKNQGNYISLHLVGDRSNTNGLNARITVTADEKVQVIEHTVARGFTSGINTPILFGVGNSTTVDEIKVRWLNGKETIIKNVKANQKLEVRENATVISDNSKKIKKDVKMKKPSLVKSVRFTKQDIADEFNRREQVFDDFFAMRLLPNKLSMSGPCIAVGDINGDKRDDFFLGGAEGQAGILGIQLVDGSFQQQSCPAFMLDSTYEDQAALFFDIDVDGDLDLYVASGGSESALDEVKYREDRVYLNDGKGIFTRSYESLVIDMRDKGSSSCVTGCDIDKDGDIDLFVGGRFLPGAYPKKPRSYILYNDKGVLRDITMTVAPELQFAGMVTSALWTDYNNDNAIDLIVVGEWMTPKIYKNDGNSFVEQTTDSGLGRYSGWWNSINGGDFDNDGDIDYIVGNAGHCSRYSPTATEPVKLYANDFDDNGSTDLIMSMFLDGKEVPARLRDALVSQMPTIQKRFPEYTKFANAGINDFISGNHKDTTTILSATHFASSLLENKGNGKFVVHDLPPITQSSPMFGTYIDDLNGDGNLDIVSVGNFYGPDPEMWRYDAGTGNVLYGNGSLEFVTIPYEEETFFTRGDTRAVASVLNVTTKQLSFIVSVNGAKPLIFTANNGEKQGIQYLPFDNSLVRGWYAELSNGKTRKHERYFGSGYYSQSSGFVTKSSTVKKITYY